MKKNVLKKIKHSRAKKYETVILLNPDMDEKAYNEAIEKITKVISDNKGDSITINDWGIRKLSYDIKKFNRGRYVILHFFGESTALSELERNLRIMDNCIRYQTLIFTKDLEPKKEEEIVNG